MVPGKDDGSDLESGLVPATWMPCVHRVGRVLRGAEWGRWLAWFPTLSPKARVAGVPLYVSPLVAKAGPRGCREM